MKLKISIIASVLAVISLVVYQTQTTKSTSLPSTTQSLQGLTKIRQHINIEIDYEKLPKRNEIRLIGKINTNDLKTATINYKWVLTDNISVSHGNLTGTVTKDTREITLDVRIKDMNKKFDVRLEAFVNAKKVKIGNVKTFTYDPTNEDVREAEAMEAQSKINTQTLSKEEFLEKEMQKVRKISVQQ